MARLAGVPIMEDAPLEEKKSDPRVSKLFYKYFERIQIDLFAIPKVYKDIEQVLASGGDEDKQMKDLVRKYSKDKVESLGEELKITRDSKEVIRAFTEKKSAEGKKLSTDGKVLDGLWMGGKKIAEWDKGKIFFNDLGSKAAQIVQNAIRREAPKNDIAESFEMSEAVKAGTFFVVVDVDKPGGKMVSGTIHHGAKKADVEAARYRDKGRNVQVIDALWYGPAKDQLIAAGIIGEAAEAELTEKRGRIFMSPRNDADYAELFTYVDHELGESMMSLDEAAKRLSHAVGEFETLLEHVAGKAEVSGRKAMKGFEKWEKALNQIIGGISDSRSAFYQAEREFNARNK